MFLLAAPSAPPVVTLTPAIDIRERIERRTDRDFNKSVNDNRTTLFSRGRFIVNIAYGKNVTGQVQYRYAHDSIFTKARDWTDDRSDIDHAYLAFKTPKGLLTVGRQEVVKGQGRLLGTAEFTQIAKAYDGVRFTNKKWDFFAGKLEIDSKPYPAAWMGMVSHTSRVGETMIIAKQDEAAVKDVEIYTVDHRYVGSRGPWTATVEGAYQFGKNQNKDVEAWAGTLRLDRKLNSKVTVYAEADAASGGSSAKKVHTFDQLFAGCHWMFGQMDMQGWKNLQYLEVGVNYVPNKRWNLGLHYGFFELMDAKDGWYGAGGSLNSRVGGSYIDATGSRGRDLGQELDLTGTYAINKHLQLQFGVAYFQPGGFQKSFNGSDSTNQYWGYFGITAKY